MELSSDNHSRDNLVSVSQALTYIKIEHKLTFTKKTQKPKRVIVPIQADNVLVSSATSHVIDVISNVLCDQEKKIYSLTLWGPFKSGFQPEDGEILKYATSFKLGHFTGRFIGAILRIINKKDT